MIQSIIINKVIDIREAYKWIISHGYEPIKLDITKNFYRFRLVNPTKGRRYAMKRITPYIEFVIEY